VNKNLTPVEVCRKNAQLIILFRRKFENICNTVHNYQLTQFAKTLEPKVSPIQQRELKALRNSFEHEDQPLFQNSEITNRDNH